MTHQDSKNLTVRKPVTYPKQLYVSVLHKGICVFESAMNLLLSGVESFLMSAAGVCYGCFGKNKHLSYQFISIFTSVLIEQLLGCGGLAVEFCHAIRG